MSKPRRITARGKTRTLKEWSEITGLHPNTITSRIDHLGLSPDEALARPAAKKFDPRSKPEVIAVRPVPPLRRHTSGRAWARWVDDGVRHTQYFGPWNSREAALAYQKFAAEWHASHVTHRGTGAVAITVARLMSHYVEHCRGYYVKEGKVTSEYHGVRAALTYFLPYATLRVSEVKGRHLEEVQGSMVRGRVDPDTGEQKGGVARTTVNQHCSRIARMFRWGVGKDLVPPDVAAVLESVPNLQAGRSEAYDPEPVTSVADDVVAATLPHLDKDAARRKVLADLIAFIRATGMRPGEACAMKAAAIERPKGERLWCYRAPNKNQHRTGQAVRPVWLGPKAQAILARYLKHPGPGGHLWHYLRPGWNNRATVVSRNRLAEIIREACDRAGIERWHPHQLRHSYATEVSRRYESDAHAAAAIGDTPHVAAEVYTDPSEAVARRVALAMG